MVLDEVVLVHRVSLELEVDELRVARPLEGEEQQQDRRIDQPAQGGPSSVDPLDPPVSEIGHVRH